MQEKPFLSVIIPTRQRLRLLVECLDSLSSDRQTLAKERYEVIVTDDCDSQSARNLVRERYPWVKWVAGPHRGPGANRNSGAAYALGEWLVFIDDDCTAEGHWLEVAYNTVREETVDLIEGRTIIPNKEGKNPLRRGVENCNGGNFLTCNMIVRKSKFEACGGFDEDFSEWYEDQEFGWRFTRTCGYKSIYQPHAVVFHPAYRVSPKRLVSWALHTKWKLLYELKTGQSVLLSAGPLQVLVDLLERRIKDPLLRTTRRLFNGEDSSVWFRRLLITAWSYITFPFMLPYWYYWEMRFRKQLVEHSIRTNNRQVSA